MYTTQFDNGGYRIYTTAEVCETAENPMNKNLKRLLILLAVVLVVAFLSAPTVMRGLSLPNSMRIANALQNLQIARITLREFQASHNGLRPQTFGELKEYAVTPRATYTPDQLKLFKKAEYMYYPNARGSDPLVLCYLPFSTSQYVCWLSADGEIQAAKSTQWPMWRMRSLER